MVRTNSNFSLRVKRKRNEVEQFAVTLVNSKATWLSLSVVLLQVVRFTHQVCYANYCAPRSALRKAVPRSRRFGVDMVGDGWYINGGETYEN